MILGSEMQPPQKEVYINRKKQKINAAYCNVQIKNDFSLLKLNA
jgi:hypothetical protein